MYFFLKFFSKDMMGCPVCLGAYSWKEDLLRHFGAVHRLEGLVRYLESEYPAEPCPDKCRVPRSLFKDLMPHSKVRTCQTAKLKQQQHCSLRQNRLIFVQ
jgi:hypothetical protein